MDGVRDVPNIVRIVAPFEPRLQGFERFRRAGRLVFTDEELELLTRRMGPRTIVLIEMDRPAIIPEILDQAGAVLAFCGASDAALLDVVFGECRPQGRLPFDLPRSMDEVERHDPDRPGGTDRPLLNLGWSADVRSWADHP